MVTWAFVVSKNASLSVFSGVNVAFTASALCSPPLPLYSIQVTAGPVLLYLRPVNSPAALAGSWTETRKRDENQFWSELCAFNLAVAGSRP